MFDKDRFPCKGNPDFQRSRAETDYWERFSKAESSDNRDSAIKSVFFRSANSKTRSRRKFLEMMNVITHKLKSMEVCLDEDLHRTYEEVMKQGWKAYHAGNYPDDIVYPPPTPEPPRIVRSCNGSTIGEERCGRNLGHSGGDYRHCRGEMR